MQELIDKFIQECCSTCKAEHCDKGIVVSKYKYKEDQDEKEMISVKCVDYEKDADKVKGYRKPLEKTATVERCVMPKLWSR